MLVRIEEIPEAINFDSTTRPYNEYKGEWSWLGNSSVLNLKIPEWADKPVFHDGHWCWEGDGNKKKIVVNKYLTHPENGMWYKKMIDFSNMNTKELTYSAGVGGHSEERDGTTYEYIDHMSIPLETALGFAKQYAQELTWDNQDGSITPIES